MATVIDCHVKTCIGYAMAEYVRTELVITVPVTAHNHCPADGVIFHPDRGTQSPPSRPPT